MSKAAERKVETAVANTTAKVIDALGDLVTGKKKQSKKRTVVKKSKAAKSKSKQS